MSKFRSTESAFTNNPVTISHFLCYFVLFYHCFLLPNTNPMVELLVTLKKGSSPQWSSIELSLIQ